MSKLPYLTPQALFETAKNFCQEQSVLSHPQLTGVTDGKAVGTYIEQKFLASLSQQFEYQHGNSASGIDIPDPRVMTDIKATLFSQPQSSSPFRNAEQKVYGLGYNILLFVYQRKDTSDASYLHFTHCVYISAERTADYTLTKTLNDMLAIGANKDDIMSLLSDRGLPGDEVTLSLLADKILKKAPPQGYLTISNALQWRLQYSRVISLQEQIEGIMNYAE